MLSLLGGDLRFCRVRVRVGVSVRVRIMVRALIKCAFARRAAHLVRCADWPNAPYIQTSIDCEDSEDMGYLGLETFWHKDILALMLKCPIRDLNWFLTYIRWSLKTGLTRPRAHKNCPSYHCSWLLSIFSLQYRYNDHIPYDVLSL